MKHSNFDNHNFVSFKTAKYKSTYNMCRHSSIVNAYLPDMIPIPLFSDTNEKQNTAVSEICT